MNRDGPLVQFMRSPHHHDETATGAQRVTDIAERRDRIVEEHRAVATHGDVEVPWLKAVNLRVAMLEPNVAQPLG